MEFKTLYGIKAKFWEVMTMNWQLSYLRDVDEMTQEATMLEF